jgi:hypothetical protein
MARDYARVRVDMWILDGDVRELSPAAQHLYFVLLTSPSLSYCGVADWRPGRLAALAKGWTADDVRRAATELSAHRYIVIDEETEEVLVRTFIRHDGLMKEARMAVSMVKAFATVASNTIRGVIVHELRRLRATDPEAKGWRTTSGEPGKALALLDLDAIDPVSLGVGLGVGLPDGLGVGLGQTPDGVWGSVSGSTSPAPTPAPTPKTSSSGARKRATPAPDDFTVDPALREWAAEKGIRADLDTETEKFLDHHRAKGSTFLDWRAAWRTWMNNATKFAGNANVRALRPGNDNHAGMVRAIQTSTGRWRRVYDDEITDGKHTEWRPATDV